MSSSMSNNGGSEPGNQPRDDDNEHQRSNESGRWCSCQSLALVFSVCTDSQKTLNPIDESYIHKNVAVDTACRRYIPFISHRITFG